MRAWQRTALGHAPKTMGPGAGGVVLGSLGRLASCVEGSVADILVMVGLRRGREPPWDPGRIQPNC
jgi:hypothetical protein